MCGGVGALCALSLFVVCVDCIRWLMAVDWRANLWLVCRNVSIRTGGRAAIIVYCVCVYVCVCVYKFE